MSRKKKYYNLDEFLLMLHQDVENFKELWIKENKKNPENWPMKNELGEWYEQFAGMDDYAENIS